MELLREHGHLHVDLADLARAWNPASTKRALYGPLQIKYILHPDDGGVDATILDLDPLKDVAANDPKELGGHI